MADEKLYGAKCHICAHLAHQGEHATAPIPWLPKPADQLMFCPDCDFCQGSSLIDRLIRTGGLDLFGPDVREAVEAFKRGDDHPLIDSLREECLAIDAELSTRSDASTPEPQ